MTLPKPQLTAWNKSASRKSKPTGFYHAIVTRVVQPVRKTHYTDAIIDSPSAVTTQTDALIGSAAANTLRPDVYIRVPRLAAQFEFGPIEYVGAPPAIGDRVWATFKEGRQDELAIVIGGSDPTESTPGSSPLTTKGDLHGYDTDEARVPVGSDGEFLKAASGDAQGVAWAAITESDISDLAHEITVRKNTGADVGTRGRLNFIEGTNVTLTVTDDAGNDEVDITIASAGSGGASGFAPSFLLGGM